MRRLWTRARAFWQALRRPAQLDDAMHEEMRFHIEMEADRLVRERGLDPREARRLAFVAFGGIEKYKEEGRATRGLRLLDALSLDARLGVRMLVKHRGLTVAGGFAMAVAIAIGATFFEAFTQVTGSALPVEEGDRIVAVQYATQNPGRAERKVLHDLAEWRQSLRSVEQLSAWRTVQHNLVIGSPPYEAIEIAEMTASGFAVARTPPLLGRYLVADDERAGARPVIVIGHQAWQSRFGGDAQVVGRAINLGGTATTVVGVMPARYRFPRDHQYWIPLRVDLDKYPRLEGPSIYVFGRLKAGVTVDEAQAELTVIGQRTAAAHPRVYDHLRPLVVPYTHDEAGLTDPFRLWMLRLTVFFVAALTFVVAVNVAILVYARTVTRMGEIAVRTALGASRRRILAQLFVEALALSTVGTAGGLLLTEIALRSWEAAIRPYGVLPFWVDLQLSATTVMYAIVLSVGAAMIIGVVPGLKATGRRVHVNLRELDNRTGTRLGGVWTTLVVAQVAIAVTLLPTAVDMTWQAVRKEFAGSDPLADRLIVGVITLDDEKPRLESGRAAQQQRELMSRLEAEPGVSAVTFSSGVPGFASGRAFQFEAGQGVKYPEATMGTITLDVDLRLFDVYSAELLAGRRFSTADLGTANAVIVNESFARQFIEGSPIGARLRYVTPDERAGTSPGTSYQVIGVVRDFPRFPAEPGTDGEPTVYHPAVAGDAQPFVVSVRFNGEVPGTFVDRFHAITAAIDPAIQLRRVTTLTGFYLQSRSLWRFLAWCTTLVMLAVLLLSAAGIYAMMSFTVAQRTREIAIRSALGAAPHRLLLGIFKRAGGQLTAGVVAGSVLSLAMFQNSDRGFTENATFVVAVAALMIVVGLLAACGPARRGLRIQPSQALRD